METKVAIAMALALVLNSAELHEQTSVPVSNDDEIVAKIDNEGCVCSQHCTCGCKSGDPCRCASQTPVPRALPVFEGLTGSDCEDGSCTPGTDPLAYQPGSWVPLPSQPLRQGFRGWAGRYSRMSAGGCGPGG